MTMTETKQSGGAPSANSRKRRHSDNPLSAARGKKKAETLWHRKSGAGFALFVRFYAQQPDAVSSRLLPTHRAQDQPKCTTATIPTLNSPGAGLSRAAKRRKKKKGKNNAPTEQSDDVSPSSTDQQSTTTAIATATSLPVVEPPPPNSKLIAALDRWKNNSICHDGSFRSFLAALSNPLPLTFRLRQSVSKEQLQKVRDTINSQFSGLLSPLPFDDDIYQAKSSDLSKETLGKVSPKLKDFLVTETQRGTLARQELGSILPVLALAKGGYISSGSRVLDMCASPGSKTLQALEIVGSTGRVKANDINQSRLDALREAVVRSGVPHVDRIKYTMHDASKYPIPTSSRLFDAIVCDVPCSGDGTIRKDAHILPGWTPNTSNALHALQLRILKRAIQCVKVGGVVSYSTCSLNPVEDEAVVCAALAAFGVSEPENESKQGPVVELMDWPTAAMPGFCARPGVTRWDVADYAGDCDSDDDDQPRLRWHTSFQQATEHDMPDACTSMWPPEKVPIGLEKCVRLHPQDNNSGGFFVTLLRRIR